jgi:DDE family transposase
MVLTDGIRRALQDGTASLKGYARRLFMARTVRDFGPGGQRFAEKGVRVKAQDHDFKPDAVLIPVGILVPQYDKVFIDFVPSPATSDAIVDAIDSFWRDNAKRYGRIDRLVIDLDNGPENHS